MYSRGWRSQAGGVLRAFRPSQSIDQRFRHVADDREPAAHIAVKRAVAHGQFALIAGGEHQGSELVRKGHQRNPPQAGIAGSLP